MLLAATIPDILIDGQMLFSVINDLMWTSARVTGLVMVAPLIGSRGTPVRVKTMFIFALAFALTPYSGAAPLDAGVNASSVLLVGREMLIGLSMGFILRLAFEAGSVAGELMAQGTGLSFATLADPIRGTNSGVLAQWFSIAFGLLFFAMNGHLGLIEMIVGSYRAVPLDGQIADVSMSLATVNQYFGLVLREGASIALPVMLAMLVVNLSFGVLSRAASALNPIQLGLPASVLLGLFLLTATVGELLPQVEALFAQAFATAAGMWSPG